MARKYILRVLISFDQFANAVAGGYPNETLSARAWRKGRIEGNLFWRCMQEFTDFVFVPFHPGHCEASYLYFKKPTKTCGVYYPVVCECMTHGFQGSQEKQHGFPYHLDGS